MRSSYKSAPLLGLAVCLAESLLMADSVAVTTNAPLCERQIVVKAAADYPPLFLREAKTMDPRDIARQCWKGYLTTQPEPWGMTAGRKPTLRFHFDNRALPWPRLQHHGVDGFDNNARNVGAHALLHEMLGAEKKNDPAEAGSGVVQAFRRPDNGEQIKTFKLRGLDPKAQYEVENFDGGKETRTGRELMKDGLTVALNEKPAAAVFAYQRVK